LVGERVIHVVALGERRDDQEGQAGTVPAAVLVSGQRGTAERAAVAGAGGGGAGEPVDVRGMGGGGDRAPLVVVPAVAVVAGDDDRGVLPERRLLQRVDLGDQELLLVDRVGVTGVPVLITGCLQVGDLRQIPGRERGVEVADVVLVVGLIGVA